MVYLVVKTILVQVVEDVGSGGEFLDWINFFI